MDDLTGNTTKTDDDSTWETVRRGARPTKRRATIPHAATIPYRAVTVRKPRGHAANAPKPKEVALRKIVACKTKLESTQWWQAVRSQLEHATNGRPIRSVQCLGLGSFIERSNARHQMACALLMRELAREEGCACTVAEPRMGPEDEEIARQLGFEVVSPDGDAVRPPDGSGCAVIFLPHCAVKLNEKVLIECAKFSFQDVVLFANILSDYVERNGPLETFLRRSRLQFEPKDLPGMFRLFEFTELRCPDAKLSPSYSAFNDLCVTTIKPRRTE